MRSIHLDLPCLPAQLCSHNWQTPVSGDDIEVSMPKSDSFLYLAGLLERSGCRRHCWTWGGYHRSSAWQTSGQLLRKPCPGKLTTRTYRCS